MGALDVATKPIQAAQGMFLIIKAIVIALVLLLGLPIYLLVTGQPIAFWQIEAFFLTLMLIYTFCCTPYYVILGAPLVYCILWSPLLIEIVFQDGRWAISIFLFLSVGILIRKYRNRNNPPGFWSDLFKPVEPEPVPEWEIKQSIALHGPGRVYRRYDYDKYPWLNPNWKPCVHTPTPDNDDEVIRR
jgi:hypothetical protein